MTGGTMMNQPSGPISKAGTAALVLPVLLPGVVAILGVAALGFLQAENTLMAEARDKAQVVADQVRQELNRALNYRLPLEHLAGVAEHLHELRADNPDLRWLTVRDAGGRVLFSSGTDLPRAQHQTEVVLPLQRGGDTVGTVAAAVDTVAVRAEVMHALPGLALGLLAVVVALAELLGLGAAVDWGDPCHGLGRRLAAMARSGDLALFGRRSGRGTGAAMLAANAAMANLHEQAHLFAAHAREVEEAVFDRTVAAQVARVREQVEARLGPAVVAAPPVWVAERRLGDARPLLFLAGVLMGLAPGLALGHGVAMGGGLGGLGLGSALFGVLCLRGCDAGALWRFCCLRLGAALFVGGAMGAALAGTVLPLALAGAAALLVAPAAFWLRAFPPARDGGCP